MSKWTVLREFITFYEGANPNSITDYYLTNNTYVPQWIDVGFVTRTKIHNVQKPLFRYKIIITEFGRYVRDLEKL